MMSLEDKLTWRPRPKAGDPRAPEGSAKNGVVIVVHGIRDFALWQDVIRSTLEDADFDVALTNYGRYNLIKFLLPFSYFRRQAMNKVDRDIRAAIQYYPGKPISIIAHSFGTYIVSNLMNEGFDRKFDRIIFCGSVVPDQFRFEQLRGRFRPPILNEVGTRDIWPAIAESLTTGYGSAGTYGFRRPFLRDRWHNEVGHSHFLTAEFCNKFWVPFLKNGVIVPAAKTPEPTRIWLQILSIVKLKYILLILSISAIAFVLGSYWRCTC